MPGLLPDAKLSALESDMCRDWRAFTRPKVQRRHANLGLILWVYDVSAATPSLSLRKRVHACLCAHLLRSAKVC